MKTRTRWSGLAVRLALLCLLGLSGLAQAHTATRFFETRVDLPAKGQAAKVQGVLYLQNLFKEDGFVVVLKHAAVYDSKGEAGRIVAVDKQKVAPGGSLKMPIAFALGSDGKYQVKLSLEVYTRSGSMMLGHQDVDLYFLVRNGNYLLSSYSDLYLPKLPEARKGFPSPTIAKTAATSMTATVIPAPRDAKSVLGEDRLKLRSTPKPAGTGNAKNPTDPKLGQQPRVIRPLLHQALDAADDSAPWWHSLSRLAGIDDAHAVSSTPPPTYTVSGRFSYRGQDNNLHPGWNWFVQLWWHKPDGSWEKLAGRYIPPSGNWSLSFSSAGYSGQHLLIQYRAGGYFVMPQDRNNNEYWWGDPEQTNIPTSFNIGHRVADTSNSGTVAGLGDVYNSAIVYWNKFTIHGVNPERSSAIRLFYPNTWENCGGASPWSCASLGGDIWLIPAHSDDYTIQHELAHQTNNEYWNNQRPDGAGGPHVLSNCYNDGLALREGFANAVPHWVLDGENDANPNAGGFQLETPDPAIVCNGDTNEVWVAATFWDLMDRHADGQDVLYFNNAVEVISIYLNAGVKDGIKNYRSNYRNAASSGHEPYIDDIYENNTIPVP